jgi:Mor family transcriptional regulator
MGRRMAEKNAERNREIFAAHQAGEPATLLAHKFGLALVTIEQVLRTELHKREVSADEYYRATRQSGM